MKIKKPWIPYNDEEMTERTEENDQTESVLTDGRKSENNTNNKKRSEDIQKEIDIL